MHSSPRALFADLVRRATEELGTSLSPMAISYVVELLEAELRAPASDDPTRGQGLGEALLRARCEVGAGQIASLRAVGDRSLFTAGFFGDHLWKRGLSESYYQQVGCEAYATLSGRLAGCGDARGWPELFGELSSSFANLVDLLGEVGDRTRAEDTGDLLRIYSRYLETGSRRERRRLLRRGVAPIEADVWGRAQ